MESRNNKKCVICNKRRTQGSNLLLSKFPLNSDRCRLWVKNAGIEDLAYVPIEKLHQFKYVCGSHFTLESFTAKGTRLKKNAIPTLGLHYPVLSDEILAEFPLHIKDIDKENLQSVLSDHSYCVKNKLDSVEQGQVPLANANILTQSTPLEGMKAGEETSSTTFESFVPIASSSKAPIHMTYKTTVVDEGNLSQQEAKASTGTIISSYKQSKKTSESTDESTNPLQEANASTGTIISSYKRSKKTSESTATKLTCREQRLLRQLNNAKKTLRNLAKSRVDLDKLESKMLASLVKDVYNNQKKKPQGKRWTIENKIYALAIFKRSPKAYRYMQKFASLPSVKTLQRILKDIPMEPGINQNIVRMLETKAESMTRDNKYCALLFDEMSLKKRLIYNEVTDKVEGFVDFGPEENMGRQNKIADHVLVLMIQGLKFKYKQYIGHYFVEGTISTDKLAKIIETVIKKLKEIGFTVLTTVCDQGSTNIGALNTLKKNGGTNINSNFFYLENEKIFTIFDIPHLLKSIRNNFHKAGRMEYAGKKAEWKHLVAAEEKNRNFLNFTKLNATIVNPTFKTKMRVKYAAHTFSNTVAAILKMMTWNDDSSIKETAFVIEEIDKLFDCTNGPSCFKDIKKGLRENVSTTTRHIEFWNYYIKIFDSIKFITSQNTYLKNVKCINGYKISLNSLKDIWETLKKEGFKYMNLRQLNQDSLENLFGIIRQHSVTNKNPTVTHFTAALKTSMVTGLKVPHSRSANCEADNNKLLIGYKDILINKTKSVTSVPIPQIHTNISNESDVPVLSIPDPENLEQCLENLCSFESQPVVYVSGYIAAKLLNQSSCQNCKNSLMVENIIENDLYAYISLREWWHDKRSLVYPTMNLCTTVNQAQEFYHATIADQLYRDNIGQYSFLMLSSNCDFKWFQCAQHFREMHDNLYKILCYIFIRKNCKIVNDSFAKIEIASADRSKKAQVQSIEK